MAIVLLASSRSLYGAATRPGPAGTAGTKDAAPCRQENRATRTSADRSSAKIVAVKSKLMQNQSRMMHDIPKIVIHTNT
jgi:hypothetical protein